MRRHTLIYFILVALFWPFAANAASNSETTKSEAVIATSVSTPQHLGVESCASSTCHGSSIASTQSNVLQNEFRTWNEYDPHARAYLTLESTRSAAIATKLGLESAATAEVCLGCHSSNIVATNARGPSFDLRDGVDCETCHGSAQNYLESHTSASHQENLSAGLTALEDPMVRAQLCVSCHIGNSAERKITHEIMGAGHPRLSFEVNTFSSIQPAHFVVDADYIKRKGEPNALQIWAVGQLVAAEQQLANIADFPRSGLFPELAHMDCLGCHQGLTRIDWTPNPLTQLAPGALRFNDAHLLTSYQLSQAVAPQFSADLLAQIREFSQSGTLAHANVVNASPNNMSASNNLDSITALSTQLSLIRQHLQAQPITAEQGRQLLLQLLELGLLASHQGYGAAEQSAMAINSVVLALTPTTSQNAQLSAALDDMFAALANPHDYHARSFIRSLKTLQKAIQTR